MKTIEFPEGKLEITEDRFPNIFRLAGDSEREFPPRMFDVSEIVREEKLTGSFEGELLNGN